MSELPRPATFDQAIKALELCAGKHPKNRVLPELRERADGGALRRGDLLAFAAILRVWMDAQPTETPIQPGRIDAEPRTAAPADEDMHENGATYGDPWRGPGVELLERVRDGLNALDASPDPFTAPAPIDEPDSQSLDMPSDDPFTGPAAIDDEPAPVEPVDGGEPLPKDEPGVAPGRVMHVSYVVEPRASALAPAATAPDAFTSPRGTHRSVSQVTSYHECGMRYRLERLEQTYEIPAWWNIGGNAFHETIRWWETEHANGETRTADDAARKMELAFADELAKTILAVPDVRPADYRTAGKGLEGKDWWRDHGPEMAAAYVKGQEGRETDVLRLSPDTLALELGFTTTLAGIDVKGFIDQVLIYPKTGDVLIRDYKTGSRLPDDPLQLQVYALALGKVFGVDRPMWGAYWRARRTTKTEPYETKPVRLNPLDVEPVAGWRVTEMDRAERAGFYPARPSSFCGSCGVRASCPVMGPPETRRLDLITA